MGSILVITGFCKTVASKWSYFLNRLSTISNKYKKASFYGWGSTAARLQPLQGCSLLFANHLPEIPGAHFIELGRMKG